jgi:hypothetical protein
MVVLLLRLGVDCVFAAEAAEFVHFQFLGCVLLVFHRVVVSLLALVAAEYNLDAHIGTSIVLASLLCIDRSGQFQPYKARKINLSADR